MGKSPGPVTYIPKAAPYQTFEQRTPEPDYKRAGEYLARMRADRKVAEQQRYQQVGTPEEQGRRGAKIQEQEAAAYAASLPQGSQYDAARDVANTRLQQAQQDALNKQGFGNPQEAAFTTPSWAVATAREQADQEQRDKDAGVDRDEADINRRIRAKDLAKKAKDASLETIQIV